MRRLLLALSLVAFAAPLAASDMTITLRIPEQKVAEYHRPYVAVWIERDDRSVAAQLAAWYDQSTGGKDGAGTKWLPDLRQWWRRGGRELELPVDGVSGATRPAGEQRLTFTSGREPLAALAPGHYTLVVEAVREVGGREVVRVPFTWPGDGPQHLDATGSSELGAVTLDIDP